LKTTGSTKLNKNAAVFTPKGGDFTEPVMKADPTKSLEKNVAEEAKPSLPPSKPKPSGPRTWAGMVGKQTSEKKPLIKVDKSRSPLKPRVQPSQPPLTEPAAVAATPPQQTASGTQQPPAPIAPPRQPIQHPAAVGNPIPHPQQAPQIVPQTQNSSPMPPARAQHPQQQRRSSPPRRLQQQPIQRPPNTTNATTSATRTEPQRPSKPRPVWPKIKPSSNKITTTIISRGDRDSSSSEELMNPETGSTESKEQDSASGLASDLDEMSDANEIPKVKTLDMPMELLTTSVAQPQMWAQLASHTQIWAKGAPPIQDPPRSKPIVQKTKAGSKFLKQGDPRGFKEKRFKKRPYSNKVRRNHRNDEEIGGTW